MEPSQSRPEVAAAQRAACLLSGGMDSAFALYWALHSHHLKPAVAVFFNYGQKGAGYEWAAAKKIADILRLDAVYYDVSSLGSSLSGSTHTLLSGNIMQEEDLQPDPRGKDSHGNAATFVPGRNLIQLSLLSTLLYTTGITNVVGGWNAVDVDYPDCSSEFLSAAGAALTLALGSKREIRVHAPAIQLTKSEIVRKGVTYGVPWPVTRSCYSDHYFACGKCDSCLVRAKAFYLNDMTDPAYFKEEDWDEVVLRMIELGYLLQSGE